MYKGIIFDKAQTKTFLSMAAQEGLICEKGITDGVYRMFTGDKPSFHSGQSILEQIVVSGAVYIDPFLYNCLDGELIETGFILPYSTDYKNDVAPLFAVDTEAILWTLEKKRETALHTKNEISKLLLEWFEKANELLFLEGQYNLTYHSAQIGNLLSLETKSNCKSLDMDYFLQLGDFVFHHPIFTILSEYSELLNAAYYNDLLLPLSYAVKCNCSDSSPNNKNHSILEGKNAVQILKYTSKQLNRIYIAHSLKDSIELTQTDSAKAYRAKVDEWISCVSSQCYDEIPVIEKDIIKAQQAARKKRTIEKVGKISTIIGMASTVASLISPPFSIISATATVAGLANFVDPTKKYLWASFGISYE